MVRETLQRYARKEAEADAVMRALVHHDGWFAPVLFAREAFQTDTFERVSLWGTETMLPPGRLWFFTDHEAGTTAMEKGGVQEMGWFIKANGFELARLWARVARLERLMAGTPAEGSFEEALLAFDGLMAFATANGVIATAVGAAGLKNPAMAFTAPDCAEKVKRSLPPEVAATLRLITTGSRLFERFDTLGVDGVILNPMGPGPGTVLAAEACKALQQSMRAARK